MVLKESRQDADLPFWSLLWSLFASDYPPKQAMTFLYASVLSPAKGDDGIWIPKFPQLWAGQRASTGYAEGSLKNTGPHIDATGLSP